MTTTSATATHDPRCDAFREKCLDAWDVYGFNVTENERGWSLDLPASAMGVPHDAVRVAVSYENEEAQVFGLTGPGGAIAWSASFGLSVPFGVIVATVHEAVGLDA